jgi:hypothetical protein
MNEVLSILLLEVVLFEKQDSDAAGYTTVLTTILNRSHCRQTIFFDFLFFFTVFAPDHPAIMEIFLQLIRHQLQE